MFLWIGVIVLTHWGCGSSNNSEPSHGEEGNESGLRLAIQKPSGADPADIDRDRFEISVTGPGISLYSRVNPVGDAPRSVALRDVDGDQVLDIVTANRDSNNVSILLGRRDGGFEAAVPVLVGDGPVSVALGDVNGNQVLDIVTANFASNNVSILLGIGDGSFEAAVHFSVGDVPQSVALGDVDGKDGLDIVTANRITDDVSILLGIGDGTFVAVEPVPVGGDNPLSVALGDVNDDDRLDVVTANRDSDDVSILLGSGGGNFMDADSVRVGSNPVSVALGDVDGKDGLDIVTANFGSDDVSILLGNGDGNFVATATFPVRADLVSAAPRSVALSDVNGDQVLDIVTANNGSDDVSILLGNGDGSFVAAETIRVGDGPFSIALVDVDGDQVLDVVTANRDSNDVSILLGSGGGVFISEKRFFVGGSPTSVALVAAQDAPFDVNGDRFLDIITTQSGANSVFILRSDTSLKNIPHTHPEYKRVTIDGHDQLVFYLTLLETVKVLGPNRTVTVRAFLPNVLEPAFSGRTPPTFLRLDRPVVVPLTRTSSSE